MNEQLIGLNAAMEILPDAVLIVNVEQAVVGCNQIAEALFGYRPGELVGRSVGCLIPPAQREAHQVLMKRFEPSGEQRPMQDRPILYGVSKSGKKLPLSIGISTIGAGEHRLFIAIIRDARSMDDTLEGAAIAAETDPLTKLGNRRCLTSALADLEREPGRSIGVLFLDLNDFKPLNDNYGHEAGDDVLRIVARRLRNALRASDQCVRLGGDEFVVILPDVNDWDLLSRIALKLHESIAAPLTLGSLTIRVGVSIGGVVGEPCELGGTELLRRADAAMYRAKREQEAYSRFQPSLDAAA